MTRRTRTFFTNKQKSDIWDRWERFKPLKSRRKISSLTLEKPYSLGMKTIPDSYWNLARVTCYYLNSFNLSFPFYAFKKYGTYHEYGNQKSDFSKRFVLSDYAALRRQRSQVQILPGAPKFTVFSVAWLFAKSLKCRQVQSFAAKCISLFRRSRTKPAQRLYQLRLKS